MTHLLVPVLAASTAKSIGVLLAVIVIVGFLIYAIVNIVAGRGEVASEIELAPNRKPYLSDEEMEGPKLERALSTGLVLLAIIAIGLPLYWLAEPGRQDGAVENFDRIFVSRGERLFAPTAEGGYDCAGCHGPAGVGGVAPFTLMDRQGEFVAGVSWAAPALNTVLLRFSEQEVREILIYGRKGTPMPAWGAEGGGPLTDQQISELIAYIRSIQISSEDSQAEVEVALRAELDLDEDEPIDYDDPAVGEALFNLGLDDGTAGGAYSCARCHTKGASITVDDANVAPGADLSEHIDFEPGSGAFGFSLRGGIIPRQFLTIDDLIEFLTTGSEFGQLYGQRGQGTGRMPGFGDNPNTEEPDDGMFTKEMVCAVAKYEASLGDEGSVTEESCTDLVAEEATTTTTAEEG